MKDITEIEPEYITGLRFHYVTDMDEVMRLALLDEKVKDAVSRAV
jgi:ATP-dependent Lon protease